MKQSWFVLADDLTGAADCAIGFAKNGMVSDVLFESDTAAVTDAPVLAVDAASRSLTAAAAAQKHAADSQLRRRRQPFGGPQGSGRRAV